MLLAGTFLAWAVYARIGQPKEPREAVPFGTGDWIAMGGGLAAWAALAFWLHPLLFGVAVMPG